MTTNPPFAAALRAELDALRPGWSQPDVARNIGRSQSLVSLWLLGDALPSRASLDLLCRYLATDEPLKSAWAEDLRLRVAAKVARRAARLTRGANVAGRLVRHEINAAGGSRVTLDLPGAAPSEWTLGETVRVLR